MATKTAGFTKQRFGTLLAFVASLSLIAAALGARAADTALPTPEFHHLHLNVPNPDASIAFYEREFPTTSRATLAGLPALKTGHVHILFTKVGTPAPVAPQSAYWHFGWHVPSARDYWQRYTTTQAPLMPLYTDDGMSVTFSNEWWPGTLTKPAIEAAKAKGAKPQAGGYGYLRGPDGEKIEFQGDLPAERFNHVHMFQEDVFCAELWYAKHLGAPVSASGRRAEGRRTDERDCKVPLGEPTWLSLEPQGTKRTPAGGVAFGDVEMNWYQRQGTQALVSSRGQLMDHVGLAVADLDGWLAKLRGESVRVLAPPYALGDTRAFLIEGPSHEAIELVEQKPR